MLADPGRAQSVIWELLAQACSDRSAPWRTPMLATVCPAGAPRVRALVLRAVDQMAAQIQLHSDARSGKIADIAAEPRVALGFWDPERLLQLRLEGEARLERDPAVLERAWARVPADSRRNYAAADAPGAPLRPGGRLADGLPNFAIITVQATRLEWLWLGADGHLRGELAKAGAGWSARALQP